MRDAERIGLAHECSVFARHITGAAPPEYVTAGYVRAHAAGVMDSPVGSDALDRLLLRTATRARPLAALADIYARLFRKGGLLRRKLVLLAAILESTGSTQHHFEPPAHTGRAGNVVALTARGALFAVQAGAALLLFAPAHAALRLAGRTRKSDAATLAGVRG